MFYTIVLALVYSYIPEPNSYVLRKKVVYVILPYMYYQAVTNKTRDPTTQYNWFLLFFTQCPCQHAGTIMDSMVSLLRWRHITHELFQHHSQTADHRAVLCKAHSPTAVHIQFGKHLTGAHRPLCLHEWK